jgi:hypothetical protein
VVEAQLPGERVVGLFYAADLSAGARAVDRTVDSAAMRKALANEKEIPAFFDKAKALEFLGFDPSDSAAWSGVGLAVEKGIAIAVLAQPWTVVVAIKAPRFGALVGWVAGLLKDKVELKLLAPDQVGGRLYIGDAKNKLLGRIQQVGGFTLISFSQKTPATAPNPISTAAAGHSLGDHPTHRRLRPAGNPDLMVSILTAGLPAKAGKELKLEPGELQRYLQAFAWSHADGTAYGRWLLGDKLSSGANGLFGGDRAPPAVAAPLFTAAHLVLRLRLNTAGIADGIKALLPEAFRTVGTQLIDQREGIVLGVLGQLGVDRAMLTAGIDGQLVAALPISSLVSDRTLDLSALHELVVILGSADAAAAQRLFRQLSFAALQAPMIQAITIAGREGLQISTPMMRPVVLPVDDGIVIAASAVGMERFLQLKSAPVSAPVGAPDVFFGLQADLTAVIGSQINKAEARLAKLPAAKRSAASMDLAVLRSAKNWGNLSGVARLAGDVIDSEQASFFAGIGPGVLAAIAIPNFIKFACRAKQAKAKLHLKAYGQAQLAYFAQSDRFGSVAKIGLSIEPMHRYTYCFGTGECLPCTQDCKGVEVDTAKTRCEHAWATEGSTGTDEQRFVGCAVANLDNANDLDVWIFQDRGGLKNTDNDCR